MRCHGARTCPWQKPAPLASQTLGTCLCSWLRKPAGCTMFTALGKQASPRSAPPGCTKDDEPLGLCQCLRTSSPLLKGSGGPCLLLPLSLSFLHAAMFLCCQIGPLSPSSASGVEKGNCGHQVPCIDPLFPVSFPKRHSHHPGSLQWLHLGWSRRNQSLSSPPSALGRMEQPVVYVPGEAREGRSVTTCEGCGGPSVRNP